MDPVAGQQLAGMMLTRQRRALFRAGLATLWCLWLTACFQQPLPDLSHLPDAPADFPADRYQKLLADGWQLWQPDSGQTLVQLRVYKEGRLARLGHNHIVSSQQLQGRVAMKGENVEANLFVRLDQLEVDRPDLRAAAGQGFESIPDADDVAGTRANMLSNKVMNAVEWPFAAAAIRGSLNSQDQDAWVVKLTLHEQAKELLVPVKIERGHDRITVSGNIAGLALPDFGIPQFSILGGAIAVAEQVDLDFRISIVRDNDT